jgi:hypothetical protein
VERGLHLSAARSHLAWYLSLTSTLFSFCSPPHAPATRIQGFLLFNWLTRLTLVVTIANMSEADMSCVLKDDCITFNGDLKISFRRTIRVPDNEESHFLPPDLGAFPLKAVSQHSSKLDPAMVMKGGVFFPMYRKCSRFMHLGCDMRLTMRCRVRGYVDQLRDYPPRHSIPCQGLRRQRQRHLSRACCREHGQPPAPSDATWYSLS